MIGLNDKFSFREAIKPPSALDPALPFCSNHGTLSSLAVITTRLCTLFATQTPISATEMLLLDLTTIKSLVSNYKD
jgi:hypothetical protein